MRSALAFAFLLGGLAGVSAQGPLSAPSQSGAGTGLMRIRGEVESVQPGAVALQLSRGLSLRLDLGASAPLFFATRLNPADLAAGARLRLRVKTGLQGATAAVEVMAMEEARGAPVASDAEAQGDNDILPELTMQGAFRALEKEGEDRVLVVVDRGAERRVAVTQETTFWRLRRARIEDLKPGMSLSVVMRKAANGEPVAWRAVFGETIPGANLPL